MKRIFNKFISFALIVCMLIALPVSAQSEGKINIVHDGTQLLIDSSEEQTVTIIVAALSDDRLSAIKTRDQLVVNSDVQSLDISSLLKKHSNRELKVFVWESLETLKPLQDVTKSDVVHIDVELDGTICFSGYNTKNNNRVPFMVKGPTGDIVYVSQLKTDENGFYSVKFKILDFDKYGKYKIYSNHNEITLHSIIYDGNNELSVVASEDAGVNGGNNADTNYGTADTISCRNYPDRPDYDRKGYFKFGVSSVPKEDIKKVYFQYYVSNAESGYQPVQLNLYGLAAGSWQENTLTYNTQPAQGNFITKTSAMRGNIGMADITDYVTSHIDDGEITFVALGHEENSLQQAVASREYSDPEYHPKLVFCYGYEEVFDDYKIPEYGNGVDPIENAREMIAESTAEYTYPEVTKTTESDSLYSNSVNARLSTSSEFTTYKTRKLTNLTTWSLNNWSPYKEGEDNLSPYGGNLDNKINNGTGFFTTAKLDNGRWTLVDPDGYQFYSMGVTGVRPADSNAAYKELVDNYNADTKEWSNAKREILYNNKMNSAGAWSLMFRGFDTDTGEITDGLKYDANVIENDNPIPVACIVPNGVSIRYAKDLDGVIGSGVEKFKGNVPPVFNPDFEEKCGEIIKTYVEPLKDSPYVIGWWSDNEINDSLRMLDDALMLDPTDDFFVYTHAAAWEWLRNRLGRDDVGIWDLNDTLREEFREFVYDRYYQVMSRQFAIYAPNHLYLGARHYETSVKSKGIFAAAERYCDVVSYNLYKYWTPTVVSEWEQYADIPVLITEFYSSENSAAGGWIVENAEDVGSFYENYTLRLLEAPNVIGWHYHSFSRFDGNSVNESLTTSAKTINKQVYNLIEYFDN